MIGFDSLKTKERRESALTATKFSDMTRYDIQRGVARAPPGRAVHFGPGGRQIAPMWARGFRRPGRRLP
ncbi:MAG: hypothetical protein ACM3Q0_05050, partial [Bacteroidota bacterium]